MDRPDGADAEGLRRIERRRRHEHGGKADAGSGTPRRAAASPSSAPAWRSPRRRPPPTARPTTTSAQPTEIGRRREGQRGQDGERHAGHAEEVALPRRGRMREPAQRQDEEDAGDEIEKDGDVCATSPQPFFLYIASMRCGDQEAAEDVDRREHERDEARRARAERPVAVRRRAARRPRAARRRR